MKLIFKGIVQGVGFRPTIYRVAKQLGLKGYVLNLGSEVEVVIDKNKEGFIRELRKHLPSIAQITDIIELEDNRNFKDFHIFHSKDGEKQSLIPIDIGICEDCIREIFDKKDRRHYFPFTNCTVCGARFSLINSVPYDRERTSMDNFNLCKDCSVEYKDPMNRRYHAQTISCPTCGPVYKLYDKNQNTIDIDNPIEFFAKQIDLGKIGIVKSWGGMHIACKIEEILRFRKWYKRPQKSFAVMVKDVKTAKEYGYITDGEKKLLLSKAKPIVLLKKRKAEQISPGLDTIGIFLPYTGLHHILFSYLQADALIMTSANIPGEPMMTKNNEVFSLGADLYLLHNRNIPNRVDDSVVRLWNKSRFFLRKSRGFIPEPIDVSYDSNILCVGAGENITGSISVDKKIFVTQYIGNSKYYPTLEFLKSSLWHMMDLNMERSNIDAIGMDLHPGYDTRSVAKEFSKEFSTHVFEIQHHFAHAVSLLVDQMVDEGVVLTLDGLGYGSDGNFWGGEILHSNHHSFDRVGHLEYIPILGGDQATHDPRRLVFAIFQRFNEDRFFKDNEADILRKLIDKSPLSCSLGRVLDAISCYLGICCKRTYDGEPAMKLEKYLSLGKSEYSFDVDIKNNVVSTVDVFKQADRIIKKSLSESKKADLAYSMVKTIVDTLTDMAIEYADDKRVKTIGLTGGVSYNIPINNMVYEKVKKAGLKLAVHDRVPNGDGGISVGQNAIIGSKLSN